MSPAIGIGFLALTALLFTSYIVFLRKQHRLQDELARHCREEDAERWGIDFQEQSTQPDSTCEPRGPVHVMILHPESDPISV